MADPTPTPAPAPQPAAAPAAGTPPPQQAAPPAAVTFTQAEVNAQVERARKEEKEKLYAQIESLQATVEANKTTIENLNGKITGLTSENEALKAATNSEGKIDTEKLIKEVSEKGSKAALEKIAVLQQQLENIKAESERNRLEAYRVRKISEAGGDNSLIVSTVGGNTEAEIDASIEKAKTEYSKIAAKFQTAPPPASPSTAPNPGTPPPTPPPGAPVGGGNPPGFPGDIRRMTPKEWAAQRESTIAKVGQRFNKQANVRQ